MCFIHAYSCPNSWFATVSAVRNGFADVGSFFNRRGNSLTYARSSTSDVRNVLEAEGIFFTSACSEVILFVSDFGCRDNFWNGGAGRCHFAANIVAYGIASFNAFSGRRTNFVARNRSCNVVFA